MRIVFDSSGEQKVDQSRLESLTSENGGRV